MRRIRIAAQAWTDIEEARRFTDETFGVRKLEEYDELIELALKVLAEDPKRGRRRDEISARAWTYHIARPGKKARHLFVYRFDEDVVEVARFLYDGMDFAQHIPKDF